MRRVSALIWFLLLLSVAAPALERSDLGEAGERRRRLAAEHADGFIVLFGYRKGEGESRREAFRQENNFYYLSGYDGPGAALLLIPESGGEPYRETLFLPAANVRREAWDGPQIDPESPDAAAKTGVAAVRPWDELSRAVAQAKSRFSRLYTLLPDRRHGAAESPPPDRVEDLGNWAGELEPSDIRRAVERMRLIKSASEIRAIEQAVRASEAAHLAAWGLLREGAYEYQLLAAMSAAMIRGGALRFAYPPIIGSGPNSLYLHYAGLDRRMHAGEVVLMDVGGESSHYAADLTRTAPVGGKFSKRQREIYDLVLGAQQTVLAAIKPGMTLDGTGKKSLTRIARDFFEDHQRGLSKNFTHGVSRPGC
jgi:Xaa-Pro aminopeptidase